MKKIILIAGKACAGKDTLVKKLMEELNIPMALSFTTRPMRTNEQNGREYKFITKDHFEWLDDCGYLAEYTSYNVAGGDTWYYGLTKRELEKDEYVLAIVNPEGVKQIKELYGDRAHVIMITADDKQRIYRYLKRDKTNNVAECCRRYLADESDFANMKYDYLVENNDFEDAYKRLKTHICTLRGNDLLEETREDFAGDPEKYLGGRNA